MRVSDDFFTFILLMTVLFRFVLKPELVQKSEICDFHRPVTTADSCLAGGRQQAPVIRVERPLYSGPKATH